MNLKILFLLAFVVATVWATSPEKSTGRIVKGKSKFKQSEQSAFQKFVPPSKQHVQAVVTKVETGQEVDQQTEQTDRMDDQQTEKVDRMDDQQTEKVDRMEISAGTPSRSAQTTTPSGTTTPSKRKSGEQQQQEDEGRSSEATLSDKENDNNSKKEEEEQQTPSKKRRLGKKKMATGANRSESGGNADEHEAMGPPEQRKAVESTSIDRSVNSGPAKDADNPPSLSSNSYSNHQHLERQITEQAEIINKLQDQVQKLVQIHEQQQQTQQQQQQQLFGQQQQIPMQLLGQQPPTQMRGQQQQLIQSQNQMLQANQPSVQSMLQPQAQQEKQQQQHFVQPNQLQQQPLAIAPSWAQQQQFIMTQLSSMDKSAKQRVIAQIVFGMESTLKKQLIQQLSQGNDTALANFIIQQQYQLSQWSPSMVKHPAQIVPPALSSPTQQSVQKFGPQQQQLLSQKLQQIHLWQQQRTHQPQQYPPTSHAAASGSKGAGESFSKSRTTPQKSFTAEVAKEQQRQQQQQQSFAAGLPQTAASALVSAKVSQTPHLFAGPSGSKDQQHTSMVLAENQRIDSKKTEFTTADAAAIHLMNTTDKIEGFIVRAVFTSINAIKLSLENCGFNGQLNAILNFSMTTEYANKVMQTIEVVKGYQHTTAQFVLDHMKSLYHHEANIDQAIEEIREEINEFEHFMRESLANWSSAENEQLIRETAFLLTYCRLYHKLFKLLSASNEKNVEKEKHIAASAFKLLKWLEKMVGELRQKLEDIEKLRKEVSKWCTNLFRLEDTIESAKLAILIAFPPNSLNGWVESGRKWKMLSEMMDRLKLDEFLDFYDINASMQTSSHMDQISTYSENENNVMFSEFEFKYLRDLIVQIDDSISLNKNVNTKMFKLVKSLAILRRIIADLRNANYDAIVVGNLKSEKENGKEFLELCVGLLDEKFNNFTKKVLDRIGQLDRIRKAIFDDEGESSKSK